MGFRDDCLAMLDKEPAQLAGFLAKTAQEKQAIDPAGVGTWLQKAIAAPFKGDWKQNPYVTGGIGALGGAGIGALSQLFRKEKDRDYLMGLLGGGLAGGTLGAGAALIPEAVKTLGGGGEVTDRATKEQQQQQRELAKVERPDTQTQEQMGEEMSMKRLGATGAAALAGGTGTALAQDYALRAAKATGAKLMPEQFKGQPLRAGLKRLMASPEAMAKGGLFEQTLLDMYKNAPAGVQATTSEKQFVQNARIAIRDYVTPASATPPDVKGKLKGFVQGAPATTRTPFSQIEQSGLLTRPESGKPSVRFKPSTALSMQQLQQLSGLKPPAAPGKGRSFGRAVGRSALPTLVAGTSALSTYRSLLPQTRPDLPTPAGFDPITDLTKRRKMGLE